VTTRTAGRTALARPGPAVYGQFLLYTPHTSAMAGNNFGVYNPSGLHISPFPPSHCLQNPDFPWPSTNQPRTGAFQAAYSVDWRGSFSNFVHSSLVSNPSFPQSSSSFENEATAPEGTPLSAGLCAHLHVPVGTIWGLPAGSSLKAASSLPADSPAKQPVPIKDPVPPMEQPELLLSHSHHSRHLSLPPPPNATQSIL
jgi:hypothetical protein